jgi:hypothetical protein
MSERPLEVGDYVIFKHADFAKHPKTIVYKVVRFGLMPRRKRWDGQLSEDPRAMGLVLAPCNSRTLSVVPGRKFITDLVSNYKRLNVLEALARAAKV